MSFRLWLVACVLALAAPALGADAPPTTLPGLAARTARIALEAHPEPPLVLSVDSKSPALAQAFSTLLCAQLAQGGMPAQPVPQTSDGEAAARNSGARSLLRVGVELRGQEVLVKGDLSSTAENFWSGKSRPRLAGAAVVALSAPADDAARLLAQTASPPAQPNAPARLERSAWARLEGTLAALRIADVDGDGKPEVIALTDRALVAFSPEGKAFATVPVLGPRSATPARIPFGAVAVLASPLRVAARLAQLDRAQLFALDSRSGRWTPEGAGEKDWVLLGGGTAPLLRTTFVPGQAGFLPAVEIAGGEKWSLPGPWTAVTALAPRGDPQALFVLSGGGVEHRGNGPKAPEGLHLGAGVALADLDGDGKPELVTTSPDPDPAPEVLRVLSWPEGTALGQWEMPGPIRHIAAGDLNGDGQDEVVVGVQRSDGNAFLERIRRAGQ